MSNGNVIGIDSRDPSSVGATFDKFSELDVASVVIIAIDGGGDVHLATGGKGTAINFLGMVSAADHFIRKAWRP